jgi:hypothetical protein
MTMTTNYVENAIELAMQGGYMKHYEDPISVQAMIQSCDMIPSQIFLDPLFWSSLGKSLGWKERYCKSGAGCEFSGGGEHEFECVWEGVNEWKEQWHRFIDSLAEEKSAESFFESLINVKG